MNNSKITTKEAIMMIISVLVSRTVLSLPNDILIQSKSASLINVIYISILAVLFVILICKLFKSFPGSDILDVSEFLGGKILKTILGIIFISFFVLTSAILLRNFCESLITVYYPLTDVLFLLLFFIIAITITNKLDFNSSLKSNLIIIPIVLCSVVFLFVANASNFVPQRIFPILGEGFYNTFVVGLLNIFSFSGITFLYFLPPILKEPAKFKKIAITSIIISALYLLLIVSILLFMFSFLMNVDEIMPLYTAARYIEFGSFFQRLESVFLLIWIATFTSYLSIASKFSILVFEKIAKLKNRKPIIYPFSLLLLGLALVPKNYAISKLYESVIYKYLILGLTFGVCIIILISANIKRKAGEAKLKPKV